jgi:hypothetical protein
LPSGSGAREVEGSGRGRALGPYLRQLESGVTPDLADISASLSSATVASTNPVTHGRSRRRNRCRGRLDSARGSQG